MTINYIFDTDNAVKYVFPETTGLNDLTKTYYAMVLNMPVLDIAAIETSWAKVEYDSKLHLVKIIPTSMDVQLSYLFDLDCKNSRYQLQVFLAKSLTVYCRNNYKAQIELVVV